MNLHIATICAVLIAAAGTITASQFRSNPPVTEAAETEPAAVAELWTNPTAHIYREGDRLTLAYGDFSEVPDWSSRYLPAPPADHRWVHYGETYMLVDGNTGLIRTIVPASLSAGHV
jgi:Ni/Co efflux regulator RcnB